MRGRQRRQPVRAERSRGHHDGAKARARWHCARSGGLSRRRRGPSPSRCRGRLSTAMAGLRAWPWTWRTGSQVCAVPHDRLVQRSQVMGWRVPPTSAALQGRRYESPHCQGYGKDTPVSRVTRVPRAPDRRHLVARRTLGRPGAVSHGEKNSPTGKYQRTSLGWARYRRPARPHPPPPLVTRHN